jgi:3-oxoacyl-[acyl-carrier protein] reductase
VDLGLQGRPALVCGASSGMGFAIAQGLAAEGAPVLLVARRGDALDQARSRIVAAVPDANVIALAADLSHPDAPGAAVAAAVGHFGRLDILVTNTGGPPPGQPLDLADDKYLLAHEQNFMNVVRLCRAAVPGMRARGYGRVLNLLALSVRQVEDNLTLSATSRTAVVAYSKYLSDQVAADGVTVNSLLPGSVHTERLEQVSAMQARHFGRDPAQELDVRRARIPARRLGEPREMADLACFLASERAGFLTGLAIPVDGGQLRSVL